MVTDRNTDGDHTSNEREPLLKWPNKGSAQDERVEHSVPKGIARRLYISHFLSTWNSRVFEFGAVLYLATIYPGTLMPMSIYAFTRGLSAIIFAPTVGQYIDTGNRLRVVRVSIGRHLFPRLLASANSLALVVQRIVVAASCVLFYILTIHVSLGHSGKTGILVLLSFLACMEKLCSIMNLVSVEKDWVVVVCKKDQTALRALNAQMRRIDLMCKLLGPLFIALIDGASTEIAIIVNFAMNVASVFVEYFAIARVYHIVPELQEPKQKPYAERRENEGSQEPESQLFHNWNHVKQIVNKSATDFNMYFHHSVFLPSIAGALLYLTVLSFAGQMVTYLLSAGYTSTQISIARTLSVAFEVLATWVAPWIMGKIGQVRAGLWLSSWQVLMLVTGIVVFFAFYEDKPVVSASGLVVGTILSRVGLRGFDLCVQLIVQEGVEAEVRGAFSSVEAALQSAFELISYASTIVFFRPKQFKWPVLISVIAVTMASSAYTLYVRLRRGHLLHLDMVTKLLGSRKGKQRERERVIERITSSSDV
ncbi:Ferroporti-1 [Phaeosphaeriaceae sp. PMI808]|nr:Ferroporti-1 [Phaeosphaeriaceae sp. PMI808]